MRAKAPQKADPFKVTWTKLWADFVVKAMGIVSGMKDPERQSAIVMLDGRSIKQSAEKQVGVDILNLDDYRQQIRGMGAYDLRDEYVEQKNQLEVTESVKRIREIEAKIQAVEAEAARHNLALDNDPRIAQQERAEDQKRKEIIRKARQKEK